MWEHTIVARRSNLFAQCCLGEDYIFYFSNLSNVVCTRVHILYCKRYLSCLRHQNCRSQKSNLTVVCCAMNSWWMIPFFIVPVRRVHHTFPDFCWQKYIFLAPFQPHSKPKLAIDLPFLPSIMGESCMQKKKKQSPPWRLPVSQRRLILLWSAGPSRGWWRRGMRVMVWGRCRPCSRCPRFFGAPSSLCVSAVS